MKLNELTRMLKNASTLCTETVIATAAKARCSKAEAYRRYGRSNVDRWILEGLLPVSGKKIDSAKLEAVAASSNRVTYLPVAER